MKKLFLILLIAFIASSDAKEKIHAEITSSYTEKIKKFLEYIKDINTLNNMYKKIYYNKPNNEDWFTLVDDVIDIVDSSEDKGDEEIVEYASEFCKEVMLFRDDNIVTNCKYFVGEFHINMK